MSREARWGNFPPATTTTERILWILASIAEALEDIAAKRRRKS